LEKISMKKTLIALATVAVTTGAMAQVTLSGGAAYGYQSTKTNSVDAKGFGVDTAAFKMSASEDLGGGMKLSAAIALGGLTRGDTPTGEDFTIVVSGGFGSVLLGQIEIGSGIRGLAQAGAPVNNMEGEILGAATAGTDIVKYTAPKMGDFTFSASHTETKGLATGMTTGQSTATTVGVDYASGPIAAKIDSSSWSENATLDSRYRIAASYDLGVVKVGAGREDITLVSTLHTKYTMFGVSAPLSANVTVGAVSVKEDIAGVTRSGTSVGASYALSKRTSVSANTASWEITGQTAKDKKTTILLAHSF
jgi:predicted porin